MYLTKMEEVKTWSGLTEKEKNNVLVVIGGIFATIGTSETLCENWYNSGYVKLYRDGKKRVIYGASTPEEDGELIKLAVIK